MGFQTFAAPHFLELNLPFQFKARLYDRAAVLFAFEQILKPSRFGGPIDIAEHEQPVLIQLSRATMLKQHSAFL